MDELTEVTSFAVEVSAEIGCVSRIPLISFSESPVSRDIAAFSFKPIASGNGTSGINSMDARQLLRDTSSGIL